MNTMETTIKVSARNYREFTEKVKQKAKEKENFNSLIFLKSVTNTAIYTDKEGNRIYFVWDRKKI